MATLFYSTASPYARTAQVVLREVSRLHGIAEVATHPFHNEKDFLDANPLGKVPCLVLESGESVLDSEVICQYLDAHYNEGKLFAAIQSSWTLRTFYSELSGLLDLAVALRQEKMREEEGLRSDFWWQRFSSGIERGLAFFAQQVRLIPDEFNLLHVNGICCLDYLSFRHSEVKWRSHSVLNDWYAQWSDRASFVDTRPSE